jgi:hypothetical protein
VPPGVGLAAFAYVQWLAKRGGAPALIQALARPGLRREAAEELGALHVREAVPALLACLARSDGPGHAAVAGALGRIGDPRAAPALRRLLESDDLEVQACAHSALGAIGGEHAPEDPFARHEREVMETVAGAAREAIDSGAATLTSKPVDGSAPALFELEPRNPRACPVHVQADYDKQISLFIGPHDTWWEAWLDDRAALLGWVEETVRGIVQGRYEEWVQLGEFRQAKGVLHHPHGDREVYNNFPVARKIPGATWEHLVYEPYGA